MTQQGEQGGVAKEQLKSYVDRIERLLENKKEVLEDIKDIYTEAKGNGYDVKALKELIRLRTKDKDEIDEMNALLELYMRAVGMLPDSE